ncbi:hypothetical protein ACQR10_02785 [Bradyrhizobium sp. HKCCYLRH2060]|uniref:hypothetical protein n=1 Tax=unclassified Bradyrhizobium TaxID=2631580 RepID=UPI0029165DA7|nr:hypothetical protein [Bradyrhizobium sp. SZCCHNRI1009]
MTNVLLFLILCVLLFGAGAVLAGLSWLAAIFACLLAVVLIVAVGGRIFRSAHEEVSTARRNNQPWLYLIVGIPAVVANLVVVLLAWGRGIKLEQLPYYWVPVAMMLIAALTLAAETAGTWVPKMPGALAGIFGGWGKLLIAPVFAPLGNWRSTRALGPERLGFIAAIASTLWTFVVAIVLWWLAVLPILFASVLVYEAIR